MPESRYTQLDRKLDTVIASLGENKTSVAVLSEHMASVDKKMGELAENVFRQNGRVRKLERWQWMVMGGSVVVGAIGKVMFDVLTK